MELMADPEVASNWLGDTQNIKAVHTPDAHTVAFEFQPAIRSGSKAIRFEASYPNTVSSPSTVEA